MAVACSERLSGPFSVAQLMCCRREGLGECVGLSEVVSKSFTGAQRKWLEGVVFGVDAALGHHFQGEVETGLIERHHFRSAKGIF